MKIQLLVFQSCRPQDFIQKNINCKCNSELEGKNPEKKIEMDCAYLFKGIH